MSAGMLAEIIFSRGEVDRDDFYSKGMLAGMRFLTGDVGGDAGRDKFVKRGC